MPPHALAVLSPPSTTVRKLEAQRASANSSRLSSKLVVLHEPAFEHDGRTPLLSPVPPPLPPGAPRGSRTTRGQQKSRSIPGAGPRSRGTWCGLGLQATRGRCRPGKRPAGLVLAPTSAGPPGRGPLRGPGMEPGETAQQTSPQIARPADPTLPITLTGALSSPTARLRGFCQVHGHQRLNLRKGLLEATAAPGPVMDLADSGRDC